MILIGQYDSSFVRRVGIALTLYGIPFEHRPWSIFGKAGELQAVNPLIRVPTLVLNNGEVLIESHLILDYLDSLVPADRRLFPVEEPARHRALKVASLATGFADKGVALFYEKALHKDSLSPVWVDRCVSQIQAALTELETDRAARTSTYWFGERLGHADIAVACALRHTGEAHPGLVDAERYPALTAHAARMEALPVFKEISQPFIAPT